MTPTDVLRIRRIMLDKCSDFVEHQWEPDTVGWVYQRLYEVLPLADLFHVSADMTAVAKAAARTMPSQPLLLTDLPADTGLMVWDAMIGQRTADDEPGYISIVGIVWHLEHTDLGTLLHMYGLSNGTDHMTVHSQLMPVSHVRWAMDLEPPEQDHDQDQIGKVVLTTWVLMQQALTTTDPGQIDRPERRRHEREGLPAEVVTVRLRRRSTATDHLAEDDPAAVEWSHRWLVGGHWRNQWLPSRQDHRLQWIAPYIKGPAGLPLVVKERVTAWIR